MEVGIESTSMSFTEGFEEGTDSAPNDAGGDSGVTVEALFS